MKQGSKPMPVKRQSESIMEVTEDLEPLFEWTVFTVMQSKWIANRRDKSTRHYTDSPSFNWIRFQLLSNGFEKQNPIEFSSS